MMPEQEIPIPVAHLFARLDALLIDLLGSLDDEDWSKPTLAGAWTVKDIAAHLLDTNCRALAIQRDGYYGTKPPQAALESYSGLVEWLDSLNHEWVQAAKRLSPRVLVQLLEITGKETSAYYASTAPWAIAPFGVAWAGEEQSYQWMHLAREYTEKWHHQQQIREALGKSKGQPERLMTRELFYPNIATFMRGLPHTYRSVEAALETVVEIIIESEAGGTWYLQRGKTAWNLVSEASPSPSATVTLPPKTAWKLFTRGISQAEAKQQIRIQGDETLGMPVLSMLSIMAKPR